MTALPLRRRSKRSGPVDSPAKNSDLPVTAYLVLGILAAYDEQLTAGEIKTRAEFSVGHFYWSPSVSHIRRELTKLLDRGHVTSHAAELGARSVTLFEATPEGEHALRGWVKSFPGGEQVMVKHPVILKTWLATESDVTDVVEALQTHLRTTRRQLDDLIWAQRRSEEVGVSDDSELRFARAVLNYSIRGLYDEMSNIAQLHDEISRGTEADPARRVHRTKGTVRRRRHGQ